MLVDLSLAYRTVYNYPRDAFYFYLYAPLVQSAGLLVIGLPDGLQLSKDAFLPH